jgi:hypothetical protein
MQAPVTPQLRQAAKREIVRQMEQGAKAQLARTQCRPHASHDDVPAARVVCSM